MASDRDLLDLPRSSVPALVEKTRVLIESSRAVVQHSRLLVNKSREARRRSKALRRPPNWHCAPRAVERQSGV
jgi:hypothetical protein